jgi:hypothetical protein
MPQVPDKLPVTTSGEVQWFHPQSLLLKVAGTCPAPSLKLEIELATASNNHLSFDHRNKIFLSMALNKVLLNCQPVI